MDVPPYAFAYALPDKAYDRMQPRTPANRKFFRITEWHQLKLNNIRVLMTLIGCIIIFINIFNYMIRIRVGVRRWSSHRVVLFSSHRVHTHRTRKWFCSRMQFHVNVIAAG